MSLDHLLQNISKLQERLLHYQHNVGVVDMLKKTYAVEMASLERYDITGNTIIKPRVDWMMQYNNGEQPLVIPWREQ